MNTNLINLLKNRLALPLPAEVAFQTMMPSNRVNLSFTPNQHTRKSAVLILFYPSANTWTIPLILRPMYDGVHGGQMAFPGGRMERSDENLIRTALREAQEEIGIKLNDVEVLGQLTEQFIPPSNFFVQPVVGYMPHRPEFYPDAREVDKVIEVSIDEFLDPHIISLDDITVRGFKVSAPTYNVQGYKIWGATALMVAELLAVIHDIS